MTDDIDGVWTGFYTHRRNRCAITARFAISVGDLRGSMTDTVLVHEWTLAELRADYGMTADQADGVLAGIRAYLPGAAASDVISVSRLPPTAELSGYAQGPVVRFRKQYQGVGWAGWRVGEHLFGCQVPGHAVEYEGELTGDGTRVAGRWWIPANPAAGTVDAEGMFELRRGR
ncbi:hypothetical protein J0H58_06880 [bacterium]|nr:hypothetical protein [bacterium]